MNHCTHRGIIFCFFAYIRSFSLSLFLPYHPSLQILKFFDRSVISVYFSITSPPSLQWTLTRCVNVYVCMCVCVCVCVSWGIIDDHAHTPNIANVCLWNSLFSVCSKWGDTHTQWEEGWGWNTSLAHPCRIPIPIQCHRINFSAPLYSVVFCFSIFWREKSEFFYSLLCQWGILVYTCACLSPCTPVRRLLLPCGYCPSYSLIFLAGRWV